MPIKAFKKIAILVMLLLEANQGLAQDNQFLANRRSILPGSRASQMGGAYTSLSEDVSGIFYNPAGMVFGKPQDISVSTNGYSERSIRYKGTVGDSDFDEKSTGLFPSLLGGSLEWKSFSFGWALITLDSQSFNQNDRFQNISTVENQASSFNITHQQTSQYQLAGTGGGIKFGKSFSIGGSLFAYRRTLESTTHQTVTFNGGTIFVIDQKIDTENLGVMFQGGLQWRGDSLNFGMLYRSYRSTKDHTLVSTDTFTYEDGLVPTGTLTSTQGETQLFDELDPDIVKIGFSYGSKIFTSSFDIIYYSAARNNVTSNLAVVLEENLNYSIGTELILGSFVTRIGAFTNYSLFPEVKTGDIDQGHHIDFIGSSLGFGLKSKSSETNVGVVWQKGEGKAQKIQGSLEIQDVEANSLLIMLGSDYKF